MEVFTGASVSNTNRKSNTTEAPAGKSDNSTSFTTVK